MKTTLSYLLLACLVPGIIMLNGCKKDAGIPAVKTVNVSGITVNTAVVSGIVTSDGSADVPVRGVCWSMVKNPTINDNTVTVGEGSGSFTASISGLEPNTTYYVRAYARNSEGISYGNEVTFSTGQPSLATLTTSAVVSVKATTAVSGGNITSDGGGQIIARGVCWSTTPEPTTGDGITIGGTGSGSFTSNMTGLSPNNTYYVRAYATNIAGTSYGNEVSFITSNSIPPALTTFLVQMTATSAVVGGNITDPGAGSGEITDRGICWSTDPFPTIEGENLSNGTGPGSFTIDLINLSPGTTYFARAWAVNSAYSDVFYGNQISFAVNHNTEISSIGYPGGERSDAVSFVIDNKVYIGFGVSIYYAWSYNDFWVWDPATKLWTRLADFPGSLGNETVGFSIGTKGYVTSSIWSVEGFLENTFWEYDPSVNKWTQKESLPTTPGRGSPVGFSIGNKGYVGIGFKELYIAASPLEYYNDFWEWDQATEVWTRKADFPGNQRAGAVGFSIGNKGYIGTGGDYGAFYSNEFWEWDQATDKWTQKADFAGDPRSYAVGFAIGGKGYIGTGINQDGQLQDFWEWDQTTNTWAKAADFTGGPRSFAFGVSVGDKAYIGTGFNDNGDELEDFWEYDPHLQ